MHVKSSNRTREFALKNNINKISFYNQNGTVTEIHTYWAEDSISKLSKREVISLNKNDKPIRGDVYDKDGQLVEYWIAKFDKNDNAIEYKTYNYNDLIVEFKTLSYDENGNETQHTILNPNGDTIRWSKSKYNSKNQLIENQGYSSFNNSLNVRRMSYDNNGNINERIFTRPDGSVSIFKDEYDKNNNNILMKSFDIDGKPINEFSYEYTFDEFGNWITMKSNMNGGKLVMIYERSIDYFN